MKWERFFSGLIKAAFLFAFAAFLWASIHHLATFYANFEPRGTDPTGPYALAISIDATALVLTIGIMFFARSMPRRAKVTVWLFILALTAFSWTANWEYATRFQQASLTSDPLLTELNPVLASSFAFLNIAYAVVSEFFSLRIKSVAELKKELAETDERLSLEKQLAERKNQDKKSPIAWMKETAIEAKNALSEVRESGTGVPPKPDQSEPQTGSHSDQNEAQTKDNMEPESGMVGNQDEVRSEQETMPEPGQEQGGREKARSQRTLSFEEAMQATGMTKRRLENRIRQGQIRVSRKNPKRVVLEDLGKWITVSPQEGNTQAQPILQLVVSSNGHHSTTEDSSSFP